MTQGNHFEVESLPAARNLADDYDVYGVDRQDFVKKAAELFEKGMNRQSVEQAMGLAK